MQSNRNSSFSGRTDEQTPHQHRCFYIRNEELLWDSKTVDQILRFGITRGWKFQQLLLRSARRILQYIRICLYILMILTWIQEGCVTVQHLENKNTQCPEIHRKAMTFGSNDPGAMYSGVPQTVYVRRLMILASPKSTIFSVPLESRTRFSNFKSR